MIGMMMRSRHRGHRMPRLQRAKESAALGPDQPGAERRDQRVAGDLDRALRPAHGFRGGVEQPGADADDQHRDQRLHQRRGERQRDAAPRGFLVGDQIGRDHRLAVAGPGGMEDAVGEGDRRAGSTPRCRRTWRRGWSRTSRDRIRIALPAASRRCRRPARRARRAARRTGFARARRAGRRRRARSATSATQVRAMPFPSSWPGLSRPSTSFLLQRRQDVDAHIARRARQPGHDELRLAAIRLHHGQSTVILLANIAP